MDRSAAKADPPAFPSKTVFDATRQASDGWIQLGDAIWSWRKVRSSGWVYVTRQTF